MNRIKFRPSFARRLRNAEHFDFYDVTHKQIETKTGPWGNDRIPSAGKNIL
jgi:hypothetical protein